jgi:predicted HD phosphohydrolase
MVDKQKRSMALRSGVSTLPQHFSNLNTASEGAWVLAHELGHLLQYNWGMLFREIGNARSRESRGRIRRLFGAPLNSESYQLHQSDANLFACSHTVKHGQYSEYC